MEDTVATVIVIALMIWGIASIVAGLRRKFGGEDARDAGGFGDADPRLAKLYGLAAELERFAAVAAHPDDLAKHKDFAEGVRCLSADRFSDAELVAYATGANAMLAAMALRALEGRDDVAGLRQSLLANLANMTHTPYHIALAVLRKKVPVEEPIVAQILRMSAGLVWDAAYRVSLCEFVGGRLEDGEAASLDGVFDGSDEYVVSETRRVLEAVDSDAARRLIAQLPGSGENPQGADLAEVIGTVWDARTVEGTREIVAHEGLTCVVDEIVEGFDSAPSRSALIVGDHGVGKTVAVKRVGATMFERGWKVFVAGHTDLIAGQIYIGQFEERMRGLVQYLRSQPGTLWIIPGFEALAFSGRHQYSPVSALDTLLPSIEAGEIRIVAEMSLTAYEQLVQRQPRVAAALRVHRVDPLDGETTLAIAREWLGRRGGWGMKQGVLDEAMQLARHFQSDLAAPGNLMRVLALTVRRLERERGKGDGRDVGVDDVIETLAEMSGLPSSILDERETLDLGALRDFFHRRVVGQDEAIACLVERVAMIKAGVTDPTRPSGVFLFAGPTGTGKTEIVKTLAEWLFGSPDRMIRIDMSELQTPQSLDRLIGSEDGGGALTDLVREQPFSIILLDEFEKAHPNVWDLFLQLFDDGRLTDRRGRRADFRHTIVVLTSNLGAAVPTGVPMGFGSTAEESDPEAVARAVERTFRKEFVNRIDRVVVFRPLSREVMRAILQNEIDAAFARRGLRSRSWAVEWDESALAFLLEKGFRPDLGARPLKRALDQYLLAPLALTIVERKVPAGDQFLFITRKDDRLDVEFVDPDATTAAVSAAREAGEGVLTLRSILLQPKGSKEEFDLLHGRLDQVKALIGSDRWREEKAATLSMLEMPDFWQSPERFDILGAAEYIDRIEVAVRGVDSLLGRIGNSPAKPRDAYHGSMIATAAQTLYLLDLASEDVRSDRPREAYVLVEGGRHGRAGGNGHERFAESLARMYAAWAKKRRMTARTLESRTGPAGDYRCLFAIAGFGAHTILDDENGLHVLEDSAGGEDKTVRTSVSVRVAPQPAEPPGTSPAEARQQALDALDAVERSRKIVRYYRETPSPLVRDKVRGWRTGRLDKVLAGDFDLFE